MPMLKILAVALGLTLGSLAVAALLTLLAWQIGPSTLLGHRFTVENCAAYRPDVMSALEWFGDRPLWNSSGWLRTIAN